MNSSDASEDANKEAKNAEPNDEKGKQRSARDAAFVLHEKLIDALIPGFQVEFDPDGAEQAGAFVEDALSEQDAIDSDIDLMAANMPAAANDDWE